MVIRAIVVHLHYTRMFAEEMTAQRAAVESSVAVHLSRYETSEAQQLVESGGGSLPPRLLEALLQL
eukprot:gene9462-8761_t